MTLSKRDYIRQFPHLNADEILWQAASDGRTDILRDDVATTRRLDRNRVSGKAVSKSQDPIDTLLEGALDVAALDNKNEDLDEQIEQVTTARQNACKPFDAQIKELRQKKELIKRLKEVASGALRV